MRFEAERLESRIYPSFSLWVDKSFVRKSCKEVREHDEGLVEVSYRRLGSWDGHMPLALPKYQENWLEECRGGRAYVPLYDELFDMEGVVNNAVHNAFAENPAARWIAVDGAMGSPLVAREGVGSSVKSIAEKVLYAYDLVGLANTEDIERWVRKAYDSIKEDRLFPFVSLPGRKGRPELHTPKVSSYLESYVSDDIYRSHFIPTIGSRDNESLSPGDLPPAERGGAPRRREIERYYEHLRHIERIVRNPKGQDGVGYCSAILVEDLNSAELDAYDYLARVDECGYVNGLERVESRFVTEVATSAASGVVDLHEYGTELADIRERLLEEAGVEWPSWLAQCQGFCDDKPSALAREFFFWSCTLWGLPVQRMTRDINSPIASKFFSVTRRFEGVLDPLGSKRLGSEEVNEEIRAARISLS